jgi:hypothetical protein
MPIYRDSAGLRGASNKDILSLEFIKRAIEEEEK